MGKERLIKIIINPMQESGRKKLNIMEAIKVEKVLPSDTKYCPIHKRTKLPRNGKISDENGKVVRYYGACRKCNRITGNGLYGINP